VECILTHLPAGLNILRGVESIKAAHGARLRILKPRIKPKTILNKSDFAVVPVHLRNIKHALIKFISSLSTLKLIIIGKYLTHEMLVGECGITFYE
jgi:hypothetical protein